MAPAVKRPTKRSGSRAMVCYYCSNDVTDEEWSQVMDVTEMWVGFSGLDGFEDLSDLFVHMTGVLPSNTDANGNVVVCAKDAIREMHESMARIENPYSDDSPFDRDNT